MSILIKISILFYKNKVSKCIIITRLVVWPLYVINKNMRAWFVFNPVWKCFTDLVSAQLWNFKIRAEKFISIHVTMSCTVNCPNSILIVFCNLFQQIWYIFTILSDYFHFVFFAILYDRPTISKIFITFDTNNNWNRKAII